MIRLQIGTKGVLWPSRLMYWAKFTLYKLHNQNTYVIMNKSILTKFDEDAWSGGLFIVAKILNFSIKNLNTSKCEGS